MSQNVNSTGPTPTTDGSGRDEQYLYDAFISYRHVEPDRKWAKWLHGTLETFRVPRKLVAKGVAPRVGRVFRDEEELPASSDLKAEIESALHQSRFLIVVCSRHTPESEWVNKEVVRFRELGRDERILALLIDGEPQEAFPKSLREIRRTLVNAQGQALEEIEEVEPLAADVRPLPARKENPRYLKRMARMRILACVLGCRFDDLRQREQERRTRRLAYLSGLMVVLIVLTSLLSGIAIYQKIEADRQRGVAEEKTKVAVEKTVEAQTEKTEADRQRGVADQRTVEVKAQMLRARTAEYAQKTNLAQLAIADGDCTRAEDLLGECDVDLRGWEHRYLWTSLCKRRKVFLGHMAKVHSVAFSPDSRRIVSGSRDNTLKLWDATTGQEILTLKRPSQPVMSVAFSPDGRRIVSGSSDNTLTVWDAVTGQETLTL